MTDLPVSVAGLELQPGRTSVPAAPAHLISAVTSKVFGCNFHALEPGVAYRVARGRIATDGFLQLLRDYEIRTAVDLRRNRSHRGDELTCAQVRAVGARRLNVHVRSSNLAFPAKLQRFVQILDTAPRPLLLYCKRGTDKAGFASFLYRLLIEERPIEEAWRELHFIPYGHRRRGHEGPWAFRRLLETHAPHDLRAWIRDDYPALFARERPGELERPDTQGIAVS